MWLSDTDRTALERLLSIPQGETVQSRRVADFIVSVYPEEYRADIEAIIRQWRRYSQSAGEVDGALSEDTI